LNEKKITLITGTRKGIGRYLVEHYTSLGHHVIGCSRSETEYSIDNYQHFCLDVCDEKAVKKMFNQIRKSHGCLFAPDSYLAKATQWCSENKETHTKQYLSPLRPSLKQTELELETIK